MTKILVVDDHKIFRQGMVSLLGAVEGFEVIGEAGSGASAVQLTIDLKPEVMVIDFSLPDINGIAVTNLLRQKGINIPIILLTMHKKEQLLNQAISADIKGYVLKDDAFEDLVYAIKAVLGGNKFVSPSLVQTNQSHPQPDMLTQREKEIVTLIAQGLSSKEIADKLSVSLKTIETHRTHIMEKIGAKGLADIVRYAIRGGLVQP